MAKRAKSKSTQKPASRSSSVESKGSDLSTSCVDVTFEDGIAWVTLNRPDKRNAMSPTLNREMIGVLQALELDPRCRVLILTGAGTAFSSGMDLKEYFRERDGQDFITIRRIERDAEDWQWRMMRVFPKPTIAMVNGWCFGGAFAPVVGCDLAIAADDAVFGVSEVNWGIIPAGNVAKAVAETMSSRNAMYYLMTGETFTGKQAAEMGLVNKSVPKRSLNKATRDLAKNLLQKNPAVLMQAKHALKAVQGMDDWELSADYLHAKADQLKIMDADDARAEGLTEFLDKKSFKPGLGHVSEIKK